VAAEDRWRRLEADGWRLVETSGDNETSGDDDVTRYWVTIRDYRTGRVLATNHSREDHDAAWSRLDAKARATGRRGIYDVGAADPVLDDQPAPARTETEREPVLAT
jgi:hypothetical protein